MIRITDHAIARGCERHRWSRVLSLFRLRHAFEGGIKLPKRWAQRFARDGHGAHASRCRYVAWGPVMLVVHGRTVVTTWRLDNDQLADLLVRVLFKVWP